VPARRARCSFSFHGVWTNTTAMRISLSISTTIAVPDGGKQNAV
jgi:hypothetical protein